MASLANFLFSLKVRDEEGNLEGNREVKGNVTFEEGGQQFKYKMDGGSVANIPFGSVTKGQLIYLEFDRECLMKMDPGDTGFRVGPGIFVMQSDTGHSAIEVTADVGNPLNIKIIIGGSE